MSDVGDEKVDKEKSTTNRGAVFSPSAEAFGGDAAPNSFTLSAR